MLEHDPLHISRKIEKSIIWITQNYWQKHAYIFYYEIGKVCVCMASGVYVEFKYPWVLV